MVVAPLLLKRRRDLYKGRRTETGRSKTCQINLASSVNYCELYKVCHPIFRLFVMVI